MKPHVLVLNHFAVPRGEPGGTRHVELFGRINSWTHLIIASDFNPQTGSAVTPGIGLALVPVVRYSRNDALRVLNWLSFAATATWRGLRAGPVDVVYGSTPHLLAPLSAWVIARAKRSPFVLEIRDLWPKVLADMGRLNESSPTYRLLSVLEGFLYQQADSIVVMAKGSVTELTARGISRDKITYIPNGADSADFLPSASRSELRERYGFQRRTAVYAGAHGPANGLDLLLEAARATPDILDVVLVGGGVLKTELQARAKRDGLTNVRFMDPVPKSEIPDLLHAADIGLHVLADVPLFRDAISPNKLFDYMAAGLPILTNSPGLIAELVQDANCGVAVPPAELGTGLEQLSRVEQAALEEWGSNGRRWIDGNQTRTIMAERLVGVLNRVSGRVSD